LEKVIAVDMGAGIVLIIMNVFLNPNEVKSFCKRKILWNKARIKDLKRTQSFNIFPPALTKKKFTDQLHRLPPDIKKENSFFEDVYDVVRQIPKGHVTSYGAIAFYLGTKLSARMVGWAMNASFQVEPKVPAHRVVNRNGMLTGKAHFATPDLMQQLLEKEGILIQEDTVQDFDKKFWDPGIELAI
jgi:methylated-DNA-protein-cysteine methyltransferase-like protein